MNGAMAFPQISLVIIGTATTPFDGVSFASGSYSRQKFLKRFGDNAVYRTVC